MIKTINTDIKGIHNKPTTQRKLYQGTSLRSLETNNQKKNLKGNKEKDKFRETNTRMTADFPSETRKARDSKATCLKYWGEILDLPPLPTVNMSQTPPPKKVCLFFR